MKKIFLIFLLLVITAAVFSQEVMLKNNSVVNANFIAKNIPPQISSGDTVVVYRAAIKWSDFPFIFYRETYRVVFDGERSRVISMNREHLWGYQIIIMTAIFFITLLSLILSGRVDRLIISALLIVFWLAISGKEVMMVAAVDLTVGIMTGIIFYKKILKKQNKPPVK